jgi:GDP-D-mannose dehydratase
MAKGICLQCDGFMESGHRHDFVRCGCGKSFLDGGDDYFRAGGYTSAVPDYVMTAEEFWQYLDELDKQMEEEENEQEK